MRPAGLLLVLCLLVSACTADRGRVRIGVQPFTEQAILARMLQQLIEDNTKLRVTLVSCDNTYACAQAMQTKRIDLMVEYSGTGLVYYGASAATRGGSLDEVRRLYVPLGLSWLKALGFESGFQLVMPTDRAVALGITSIADLGKLSEGVRITIPAAYLRRPGDGLFALLRRHGLRLRGEALIQNDPARRLRNLVEGRADVTVIRSSNGLLRDLLLTTLEDTLQFFPPYEAAVIAQSAFFESRPQLVEILNRLHGRITLETMQQLNYEAEVEGWAPEVVAHRFLREVELLANGARSWSRQPEIVIAVDERDQFGPAPTIAARVVREVFPGQPVIPKLINDPIELLHQGKARLALLGAERFFHNDGENPFGTRDERVEAATVLYTRLLHIVRRSNKDIQTPPFSGRVGVPPRGSGSARVAVAILDAAGVKPDTFATVEVLLEEVAQDRLDVALFFALPGLEPAVAQALADHQLILRPLPELPVTLPPFLRPARIPGGVYVNQTEMVDTVGMQVLIAGPAPRPSIGLQAGGPAAALRSQSPPVTFEQASAMARFLQNSEPPDVVLPSVWLRGEDSGQDQRNRAGREILNTVLSVFVTVFLIWIIALVVRRPSV